MKLLKQIFLIIGIFSGSNPCQSNSAACITDNKGSNPKNIGNVTDRLTIQNHEPVIHYDNGIFHTSIHFKCAPIKSVKSGQIVLLEKVKNHFYFDYFTTLACPFTVPCEAETSGTSLVNSGLYN